MQVIATKTVIVQADNIWTLAEALGISYGDLEAQYRQALQANKTLAFVVQTALL